MFLTATVGGAKVLQKSLGVRKSGRTGIWVLQLVTFRVFLIGLVKAMKQFGLRILGRCTRHADLIFTEKKNRFHVIKDTKTSNGPS